MEGNKITGWISLPESALAWYLNPPVTGCATAALEFKIELLEYENNKINPKRLILNGHKPSLKNLPIFKSCLIGGFYHL